MNSLFYFFIGPKGERLYIQDELQFELPLGSIISDIVDIDMVEFRYHSKKIQRHLESLQAPQIESLVGLQNLFAGAPVSDSLRALLLFQPYLQNRSSAEKRRDELMYTPSEIEKIYKGNVPEHFREHRILNRANRTPSWEAFGKLLSGEQISLSSPEQESLYFCLQDYIAAFSEMVLTLQCIQDELDNYLSHLYPEGAAAERYLTQHLQHCGHPSQKTSNAIFPNFKNGTRSQVYTATTITQLVAIELDYLERERKYFSRCKLCNRYFIPYSINSIYCQHQNPNHDNKKCCDIGPTITYENKLNSHKYWKIFEKNKNAYRKWLYQNKKEAPKQIQQELQDIHSSWKHSVEQAISDYQSNKISLDALSMILELPAIPQRSPLLHAYKLDTRRYSGNL